MQQEEKQRAIVLRVFAWQRGAVATNQSRGRGIRQLGRQVLELNRQDIDHVEARFR